MNHILFSQIIKRLRTERGISQAQLAERLLVDRSTITRWENGSRLPNYTMISRLSEILDADVNLLLNAVAESEDAPNVILVDDNKIILKGSIPILEEVLPNALITGFTRPSEAVQYAKSNRIALAFLDIELGKTSGFELCQTLLEINPRTNVVYLTAYAGYALDAWSTGACGFMRKPLTPEGIQAQLKKLRYPFWQGGADE
ncbi:MAG: response regulator [Oscillospiraceae bacterium]|nr:response regulator [Oscillospiraceae bacterium]